MSNNMKAFCFIAVIIIDIGIYKIFPDIVFLCMIVEMLIFIYLKKLDEEADTYFESVTNASSECYVAPAVFFASKNKMKNKNEKIATYTKWFSSDDHIASMRN